MVNIITQISKYLNLFLMAFFTLETYMVLRRRDERSRRRIMRNQIWLMVLFNIVSYFEMFLHSEDPAMFLMLICVIGYLLVVQILYRIIYRKASLILLNAMCMMLCIGFVIQSRLNMDTARKQYIIAAGATMICFIIPVFVRRVRWVSKLTWVYGIGGIILLAGVMAFGRVTGGANLNLTIGGVSFAFSEFVKITIVLFMAGMLQYRHDFRQVLIVTIVAAMHVGILALSADLGAALIYFVAYIVMVVVATRNYGYAFLGLGGMAGASAIAYRMFNHVRVRVQIWKDPMSDYEGNGYQLMQALFGIAAGGWFGTGLYNGHPDMIPLAYEDFTFAAICEEFGILFAICLILLCMGMYLLIINIALRLDRPFYKLVAMGLGTEYAFQVFLTVGGTTKFIPMTGITLPLISYGGSSLMCTIIMLSIVQGLYIMRKDEDEEIEERREARQRQAEFYAGYGRNAAGRYGDVNRQYRSVGYPEASGGPSGRNGRRYGGNSGETGFGQNGRRYGENSFGRNGRQYGGSSAGDSFGRNGQRYGEVGDYQYRSDDYAEGTGRAAGQSGSRRDTYEYRNGRPRRNRSGDDLASKIERQTRDDLALRHDRK